MDPIINSKLQIYIGSYSLVISGQHDSKPNEKKKFWTTKGGMLKLMI